MGTTHTAHTGQLRPRRARHGAAGRRGGGPWPRADGDPGASDRGWDAGTARHRRRRASSAVAAVAAPAAGAATIRRASEARAHARRPGAIHDGCDTDATRPRGRGQYRELRDQDADTVGSEGEPGPPTLAAESSSSSRPRRRTGPRGRPQEPMRAHVRLRVPQQHTSPGPKCEVA